MAESTLSIGYDDLMSAVALHLGFSGDSDDWSEAEEARLDGIVQSGYRQFLYPPAVEGADVGYEWSFLKPVASITTTADDAAQDMPDDFGRLIDGFTFAAGSQVPPILADVGEGRIRELLMRSDETGRPREAAIRTKAGTGTTGQRKEVLWYPIPDDEYVLEYRYEAFVGKLTALAPYPLGGMKHAELLQQSCLAVADAKENDARGVQYETFVRLLIASIARDKREGAKFFDSLHRDNAAHTRPYSLVVSGVVIQ